mmetsp:Transcript_20451/g.42747  ORF Transcript_20451/g.42747 Transcript_20451/m.42747 type:complete len:167 (+) Transcript_20451:105-605(+)
MRQAAWLSASGLMSRQGVAISSQLFHGACAKPVHRPQDSWSDWRKASFDLLLKERVDQGAKFCAAIFIPEPFLVVRTWRPFKGLMRFACAHMHGSSWPGQRDLSLNFPGQRIRARSRLAASVGGFFGEALSNPGAVQPGQRSALFDIRWPSAAPLSTSNSGDQLRG